MPSLFALHTSERRYLFGYLLLATLLLAGTASWVLYQVFDEPAVTGAAYQSEKIKRQQRLFDQQMEYLPLLDTVHQQLVAYRPQVAASFLEADIENELNDIRRVYTGHDSLPFYRSFNQAANLYHMLYRDKQILASKQANVRLFAQQLAECKLGFRAAAPVAPASSLVSTTTPSPTLSR